LPSSLPVSNQPSGGVLNGLQPAHQSFRHAKEQRIAVVQATGDERLDCPIAIAQHIGQIIKLLSVYLPACLSYAAVSLSLSLSLSLQSSEWSVTLVLLLHSSRYSAFSAVNHNSSELYEMASICL